MMRDLDGREIGEGGEDDEERLFEIERDESINCSIEM
jgi:hypothetical protein